MTLPPKALLCIVLISAIAGGYIEHAILKDATSTDTIKDKSSTDKDITTVIKEKPDGSKETTIVDRSKSADTKTEEVKTVVVKDWFIQVGTGLNTGLQSMYMVSASRRILGNVYIGAFADTNKEVGISLGLSF